MRPNPLSTVLLAPLAVRRLPASRPRSVLLSFDDGPVPGVTEGVLERLAAHGARGLFCVLGPRVAAAPELARAIAAGGHALGNHSHGHGMAVLPAPGPYLADMRRCSEAIDAATGAPPRFFRAPGGRLHPASLLGPGRVGMRHVLWSLDSGDWRCTDREAAAALGRRLADRVRGRDIILLHDYQEAVHALLDELLPALLARGFELAGGLDALDPRGRP
ncbi:MAG: polysaccharide deacetylase family protein [Candidatus Krumholzibacteriia bacterium]